MSEPHWLTLGNVQRIHDKVVAETGGAQGLRDVALLESALARPLNLHAYGESDLFELAASYAEGIARNHAFVDGNKRTAWTSAEVFLRRHGVAVGMATDDAHVEMMEKLAQGDIDRETFSQHLREWAVT